MKKKIVVATNNSHKLKEIRDILNDFEIVSCREMGFDEEIEENGNSFYENALIKAKTVAERLGVPALADDSGICVDALGGAPGIYSARYAGDGNDAHNNEKMLKNLENVTDRRAKFVSCVVYCTPDGDIKSAIGETEGEITYKPEGPNGFGYDPIFFSYDLNQCLGVASPEDKNKISHRFRALMKIKELL